MSNRIAITRSEKAADALVKALVEAYPKQLVELTSVNPLTTSLITVYTAPDAAGNIHVQLGGGDMAFLGRLQEFAAGYLAAWGEFD